MTPIKIQQTAEAGKALVVGVGGTGASVALQNFNAAMAGLAATATFIYICLQIYRWFRPKGN